MRGVISETNITEKGGDEKKIDEDIRTDFPLNVTETVN